MVLEVVKQDGRIERIENVFATVLEPDKNGALQVGFGESNNVLTAHTFLSINNQPE
jgi:hypothetical protein